MTGSADQLNRVHRKIQEAYSSRVDILDHWQFFVENAPDDDEAENWLVKEPLHIPFHEALFGDALVHNTAAPMMKKARKLPMVKAKDTVKRKGYAPAKEKKKAHTKKGYSIYPFLLYSPT